MQVVGRLKPGVSLEQVILRHALGLGLEDLERESTASGVMMIPIPGASRGRERGMPAAQSGSRTWARPSAQINPPSICCRTSCGLTMRPQSTVATSRWTSID